MATIENLIPANKLSPEERRKIASNGGKKSGESRRRKKAMREQMECLLSMPLDVPELIEQGKKMGIKSKDLDNQMGLMIATFFQALQGDTKATNIIRELVGERVTEIKVDTATDEKVKELQNALEKL